MRLMALGVLSAAFLSSRAPAQSSDGDGHAGFHAAAGVGAGSLSLSGNGPTTAGSAGTALMLRLGGTIGPGTVLSGELTGWSKPRLLATWVTAVVQWYPQRTQGFYVKGGAGVATFAASECCAGPSTTTTDLGFEGGTGYDIRVSRRFFLTPYVDLLHAIGNGSRYGVNLSGTLLNAGLAGSWR
jgi:hypothetical protein